MSHPPCRRQEVVEKRVLESCYVSLRHLTFSHSFTVNWLPDLETGGGALTGNKICQVIRLKQDVKTRLTVKMKKKKNDARRLCNILFDFYREDED